MLAPASVPTLLPELRAVSDAWLRAAPGREHGFALAFFQARFLVFSNVAVLRRAGQVVAFASLWRGADRREVSIDLVRYRPEAVEPGEGERVLDALLIGAMLWARARGCRGFDLGLAPHPPAEGRTEAPLQRRLADLAFGLGDHVRDAEALRAYKEKFAPAWEPRYLATVDGFDLPGVLADLSALLHPDPGNRR